MSLKSYQNYSLFPKSGVTSSLFKVLTVLKQLHGTHGGAEGSTLNDIAMFMVKYFGLDGDVKSQILATLKYAAKLNFIQKQKNKFILVPPAASLQLAPLKYKKDEMERIQCIFPVAWSSMNFSENSGRITCKRKTNSLSTCDDEESSSECSDNSCKHKKKKLKKSVCVQNDNLNNVDVQNKCNSCTTKRKKVRKKSNPTARFSICNRKKDKRSSSKNDSFDDYCSMCPSDRNNNNRCNDSCSKCDY